MARQLLPLSFSNLEKLDDVDRMKDTAHCHMNYYNEHDPFAAEWLRRLIAAGDLPPGDVDDRDIQEVSPHDLCGYSQVHLFAGIGGWSLALQLAGVTPAFPLWTGSCPCQPFSSAGKQLGTADARHVWPEMRRLIAECRPAVCFGEQVASADGRTWLAGVRTELEGLDYAVGAADLCAAGIGAPHIRQRLFWVADACSGGSEDNALSSGQRNSRRRTADESRSDDGLAVTTEVRSNKRCRGSRVSESARSVRPQSGLNGNAHGVADSADVRSAEHEHDARERQAAGPPDAADSRGDSHGLERTTSPRLQERERSARCPESPAEKSPWETIVVAGCLDGKLRRIPDPRSGVLPLAHGLPDRVGSAFPVLREMVDDAKANRAGRLAGYGNAIVPQLAALFVRAALETSRPDM